MSTSISGSDRLDAEERRELPDSAFGIPETHEFPMPERRTCAGGGSLLPIRSGK